MPWHYYYSVYSNFTNYKIDLFHSKILKLIPNNKKIKIAFFSIHLKNIIYECDHLFQSRRWVFFTFLPSFMSQGLIWNLLSLGLLLWITSLSFFTGQDAELSGTLSLVLTQCCKRIKDTVQKLASDHKDIHSSVSRVGKAIDKVWCWRKCVTGFSSILHLLPLVWECELLRVILCYSFHPCF